MKKYRFSLVLQLLFAFLVAPQLALANPFYEFRHSFKAGEITQLVQQAVEQLNADLAEIEAVPSSERNISNTVEALDRALSRFSDSTETLQFMGYVSPNAEQAKEGMGTESVCETAEREVFFRPALYEVIEAVQAKTNIQQRLKDKFIEKFKGNGLGLPTEKLEQLKKLNKELSELQSRFAENLNNSATKIEFTESELEGVPTQSLTAERTPEGNYIIPVNANQYVTVVKNAVRAETRKRMMGAYLSRAPEENTTLLERAVSIRQQIADLQGKNNWAEVRLSDRMAEKPENVRTFLDKIKSEHQSLAEAEMASLLELKKGLEPGATGLEPWDTAYLSDKLSKRDYQLDSEVIREYFPVEKVLEGMFATFAELLNLEYVEITDAARWSPEVRLFEIRDAKTGKTLSAFYLDLFPRKGKYSHAAAFTLRKGRKLPDESYQRPFSAIVANFTPPGNDRPALLRHSEVVTLFHEFGHINHQTITRVPYGTLSGSQVARDFVETPSQLFENWAWSPEVLQRSSGHYLNPNEKIPLELIDKMLRARDFGKGIGTLGQVVNAEFDFLLHTRQGPVDSRAIYQQLYRDTLKMTPVPGGNFPASFPHLMGGYDAGYYGYLWSERYADDIFKTFKAEGVMNKKFGRRLRKQILEKGNAAGGLQLMEKFHKGGSGSSCSSTFR